MLKTECFYLPFQIMYSGFPSHVQSIEDKEEYVAELNASMGWQTHDEQLKVSEIEHNEALRNFNKLCMNACLGGFCY